MIYVVESNKNKFIFKIVLLWLLISPLYYIDSLFTGVINLDPSANILQKSFKYIIVCFIGCSLILKTKNYKFLCLSFIYILLIIISMIVSPENSSLINIYIIFFSMLPLVLLLPSCSSLEIDLLIKFIILSCVIVGLFSIYEIFFLQDLFKTHWARTGGMRSISTMFNPNNLGQYLCAGLIFILFSDYKRNIKFILMIPILFGIVMSGSRTAWFSIILLIIPSTIASILLYKSLNYTIFTKQRLFNIIIAISIILTISILLPAVSIQPTSHPIEIRKVDLYTANIRLEHFREYILGMNADILFPDYSGSKNILIGDNSFLVIINSFGLLLCLSLMTVFLLLFQFNRPKSKDNAVVWMYILFYYIISGSAEANIYSFPNNQLLFISLGSIFINRRIFFTKY